MDLTRIKQSLTPARIELACGWAVFIIACITYLLTLESSASFWDCGEYVSAGTLLESGHPPGNPVWMLTARVFATFAPDAQHIAWMINAMSGILSALTVLLLYRTIVLLCRMVWGTQQRLRGVLCGVTGALILCWSDTFWYSAVEAEVYAYAAFITALTFWLALKWRPGDYRIIVLLAYLMGLSIGIHLLCLLTIPALVLIIAYRHNPKLKTRWAALMVLVSFIPVFFILYGLMPGSLGLAAETELLCVNKLGLPFNSGVLIYVAVVLLLCVLAIYVQRRVAHRSKVASAITVALVLFACGITSVGGSMITGIGIALIAAGILILTPKKSIIYRHANLLIWCPLMLFIGFSSYAMMIIRGSQNTPINQNKIDNIFALQSYIQREQYGKTPLFYGPTPYAQVVRQKLPNGITRIYSKTGRADYVKHEEGAVPTYRRENLTPTDSAMNAKLMHEAKGRDFYLHNGYLIHQITTPELNVPLTRMYSNNDTHRASYLSWTGTDASDLDSIEVTTLVDENGNPLPHDGTRLPKPSLWQQLQFFGGYQISYMYLRYLMWNFLGRQNDIPSQGQADAGNLITGIKPLDQQMTGDTDLLPADMDRDNPGHNIYYGLPLLLGVLGMATLYTANKRGRNAFWMVMTLFLLTGIAIVLFLNQTPNEPRERDYSFAGSFYAYAIWCGMGALCLCEWMDSLMKFIRRHRQSQSGTKTATALATVLALAVPIQMLSQTYDDHDRSNRTMARDHAHNLLNLCEPDAILFTDGDNYLFPAWYAREVEGVRNDVRIVNLSYLYSDWYIYSLFIDDREGKKLPLTMTPEDIAYGNLDIVYLRRGGRKDALQALRETYDLNRTGVHSALIYADTLLLAPMQPGTDSIAFSLNDFCQGKYYMTLRDVTMLDMIATNAAQGWKRPIYWTRGTFSPIPAQMQGYMSDMGMLRRLTGDTSADSISNELPKLADFCLSGKAQWGGLSGPHKTRYPGPEACHIAAQWRQQLIRTVDNLMQRGETRKALELANGLEQWIPFDVVPFSIFNIGEETVAEGVMLGDIYCQLGEKLNRPDLQKHGNELKQQHLQRIEQIWSYTESLPPGHRSYVSQQSLIVRNFVYQNRQKQQTQ